MRIPETPAQDPEHFAAIQARGHYEGGEWGHRLTGLLKCAHCGVKTRHAILRDCDRPEHRNRAEEVAAPLLDEPDSGREAFEVELRRLQGFGIAFEFRDDTRRMVSGGIHFYDIEHSKIDSHFLIRLNPTLTWVMLHVALEYAWRDISDPSRCETLAWNDRGRMRDAYFTVGDRFWDLRRGDICDEAEKWARYWALAEGPS